VVTDVAAHNFHKSFVLFMVKVSKWRQIICLCYTLRILNRTADSIRLAQTENDAIYINSVINRAKGNKQHMGGSTDCAKVMEMLSASAGCRERQR
jgi:hypothetical protein